MSESSRAGEPQLVVVGASAGGIEALSKLVSTLPGNFPAPIVVAQHLDPRRQSHLTEILARRSPLPVKTVVEHEALKPGVIYTVPSDRQVEITDHEVRVRKESSGGPQPSIDQLLISAAERYGEHLIAVILTGSGSDGAAGARLVKAGGGTVIVQDPETASFPSMPLSLSPTTVDIVATLETIGPLLYDLLTDAYVPRQPKDDELLESLIEQLRERSGIDFSAYKRPTILRRLQRRMAATGATRLRDYIRFVQKHPEEYQRLARNFLIKVTEFFRDPELFDYLRERALPDLIARARQHGNELRVWSAGCATGEEAYSLAILIAELLGDELETFSVRVFATDLDDEAVTFARRGRYPARALADVPPELVARYFTRENGAYDIRKQVRSLVIFGQHDLEQRAPFPRIDLCLCRNVLIYFTAELQARALQLFAFALRENGLLALGKTETTSPAGEFFTLENSRLKLYRRHGDRVLIPPSRIRDTSPSPPLRLVPRKRPPVPFQLAVPGSAASLRETEVPGGDAAQVLFSLPVGVVVVDRRYDIHSINGTARRLLGIYHPAVGDDFLHLVKNVPATLLRAAIDAALRGETSVLEDVEAAQEGQEGVRFLQITCAPRESKPDKPHDLALITVAEVTPATQRRLEQEQAHARQRADAEALIAELRARVEQVRAESQRDLQQVNATAQLLRETNRQLLGANLELIAANAELSSTRDTFMIAHEEAQAAIEEVETLNEELQASNEELETLNEELQATVEELHTTNSDLEARSLEMQELALGRDAERARLTAILASLGDAVLVVDRAGMPVRTNEAYALLFGGPRAQFSPEDEHGNPLPAAETPQQRAARGESFQMQFTLPGAQGERRYFEANGQPVHAGGDDQGVVVIRDISERSLRQLQEGFMAQASHELRNPLAALRGFLEMLVRRLEGSVADERALRSANQALGAAQRLTELVEELLDVSRILSDKLRVRHEPLDLAALVATTVEIAQVGSPERPIGLESVPGPVWIDGDARRLEQVLLNLFANVAEHASESPRVDVRLRPTDGQARLEVQDYGPGIPASELPRIFSRFQQGERSGQTGLGLGLYIARQIVEAHGGRIEVESREGRGTTFTMSLPLRRPAESGGETAAGG